MACSKNITTPLEVSLCLSSKNVTRKRAPVMSMYSHQMNRTYVKTPGSQQLKLYKSGLLQICCNYGLESCSATAAKLRQLADSSKQLLSCDNSWLALPPQQKLSKRNLATLSPVQLSLCLCQLMSVQRHAQVTHQVPEHVGGNECGAVWVIHCKGTGYLLVGWLPGSHFGLLHGRLQCWWLLPM